MTVATDSKSTKSTLTNLKKQIADNLLTQKSFVTGTGIKAGSISYFLNSLASSQGLNANHVQISQVDEDTLQLTIDHLLEWPLALGSASKLVINHIAITLTQQSEDVSALAALMMTGQLQLNTASQTLSLTGTLADLNSNIITLQLDSDNMPQMSELAAEIGVGDLTHSLEQLGLSVPVIETINLGLDLTEQKVIQIHTTGKMAMGTGTLLTTCSLLPEVSIEATLDENSSIHFRDLVSKLGINNTDLPDSDLKTLVLTAWPSKQDYTATFGLANDWVIDIGGSTLSMVQVEGVLQNTVATTNLTCTGFISIDSVDLQFIGHHVSDQPITFNGSLLPGRTIGLTKLVDGLMGGLIDFPQEVPSLDLTELSMEIIPKTGEFSVTASAMDPWEIPIGVDGLAMDDITLALDRTLLDNGKKTLSGIIGGELEIAGSEFRSEYAFPGEFVIAANIPSLTLSPLLQDLCGSRLILDIPLPASILATQLKNVVVAVAPQSQTFSINATSALGQVELIVRKLMGEWIFVTAFLPPKSWKFSSIAQELAVLDGLRLSDTALVLSSTDNRALSLNSLQEAGSDLSVIRGLNFVANLDMSGLGVDALLNIKSLRVQTMIGDNPADLMLSTHIDGQFDLSNGVAFGDIEFQLRPAPSNFSLTLQGTTVIALEDSVLEFVGAMAVEPLSAVLKTSMVGVWQEPFNTKGVAIADVGLDLGLSFPSLLPVIGLDGSLVVGDFEGAVAVKFDSAIPSRSMLAISFNRLYLMDVISTFCGRNVAQAIPSNLSKTVLDIGFENVDVYIVPQPTSIGIQTFDQGFYLGGTMIFWGLQATASMSIDYLEGTEITGELEPINLDGLFQLRGSGNNPKPSVYFKLSPNPKDPPSLNVSGAVELLGLVSETEIRFSDQGFYFRTSGTIFDKFESVLEVEGKDFSSGGNFRIKAFMRNDLLSYLREQASKIIGEAAEDATKSLAKAQNDIRIAQEQVKEIDGLMAQQRKEIQQERERDIKRFNDAKAAVEEAQARVNGINQNIDATREIIKRERARDTKQIQDAENAVEAAKREVDRLQKSINQKNGQIDDLKKQIKDKERWAKSKKSAYFSRWPKYLKFASEKGIEIGLIGKGVAALEFTKGSAKLILETARQSLIGIKKGAQLTPIDADPRILALKGQLETANLGLNGAKIVLDGLKAAAKQVPIDLDPRMVALKGSRETAILALEAAKQFLEGVKRSVGGMADVSQFIADKTLGGILDVRAAQFEGTLQTTQGGRVSLSLDLVFMNGDPQNLTLDFSFSNPLKGARDLAKRLLPA